jgi:hypothetical protein
MAQYSPVLPDTVTTALYQQAAAIALQHHYQLQRAMNTATTVTATLHGAAGDDAVLSVLRIAAVLTCAGHVTQVSLTIATAYCHYKTAPLCLLHHTQVLTKFMCDQHDIIPYRRELWRVKHWQYTAACGHSQLECACCVRASLQLPQR